MSDVHTRHCCVVHGCKYGEEDICSVWLGTKLQDNRCELCGIFDEEGSLIINIPTVDVKELEERRLESGELNDSR